MIAGAIIGTIRSIHVSFECLFVSSKQTTTVNDAEKTNINCTGVTGGRGFVYVACLQVRKRRRPYLGFSLYADVKLMGSCSGVTGGVGFVRVAYSAVSQR